MMRDNRYLSLVIVNELITIMGLNVVRSPLSSIAVLLGMELLQIKETAFGNREQLNLSIRWVNNEYEMH